MMFRLFLGLFLVPGGSLGRLLDAKRDSKATGRAILSYGAPTCMIFGAILGACWGTLLTFLLYTFLDIISITGLSYFCHLPRGSGYAIYYTLGTFCDAMPSAFWALFWLLGAFVAHFWRLFGYMFYMRFWSGPGGRRSGFLRAGGGGAYEVFFPGGKNEFWDFGN